MKSLNAPHVKYSLVIIFGVFFSYLIFHEALDHTRFGNIFSPGVSLLGVGEEIQITELDLVSEPGDLLDHQKMKVFFERQDILAKIIETPTLVLKIDQEIQTHQQKIRSIKNLPLQFWIQFFVGIGALMISSGIWALRPKDLPSIFFFLSGIGMYMSALSSAVYTSRDLAINAPLFKILEDLNGIGASLFGISIFALFLIYPQRIKNWKIWCGGEALFFSLWTLLYFLKILPGSALALVLFSEMLAICVAVFIQYRLTKNNPKARAILSWLGLSVLAGAGGFIGLNTIPSILGVTQLHQGYAFAFFLIIYAGIAAGIKQYRLFEVGTWTFRFLFYVSGAIFLIALDALFIFVLKVDRLPALGTALLFTGLLYLPLRDIISRRLFKQEKIKEDDLLALVLHVGFAPSKHEREMRWVALLKKIFDPLELVVSEKKVEQVEIDSDGLSLFLPKVAHNPCLQLKYPRAGRALFSPESYRLAVQLVTLIEKVDNNREAYDRGVSEERRRMAQDLHDDVGARLLTGLNLADEKLKPTIQGAISDIRSIVRGMSGEAITMEKFMADLRFETSSRLSATQISLNWPIPSEEKLQVDPELDYRVQKILSSATREIVSNVIRHSEAKNFFFDSQLENGFFHLRFKDDGKGISPEILKGNSLGFGLLNLKKRLDDLNGEVKIESDSSGTIISLKVPV